MGGNLERQPADAAWRGSLAEELRAGTLALHAKAESCGIVLALIEGRATRDGYALYLRNLYEAYRQLEDGLKRRGPIPGGRLLTHPKIHRADAIASDLKALAGVSWKTDLALLPAGQRYAQRIAWLARHRSIHLVAHAYVRHLGDLSGGRILKRCLSERLGLRSGALSLYEFSDMPDRDCFLSDYRQALDSIAASSADASAIVEEARGAFRHNIDVSVAVQAASG